MAEMKFADGTRVVDDPFVGPLNKATDGAPERFTFQEAMDRLNKLNEGNLFAEARSSLIREHVGRYGL